MPARPACKVDGCERPKHLTYHSCKFHWLLTQPIEVQERAADQRLALHVRDGAEDRARIPERLWPAGERWCAGCQAFVPLFYASSSRCRACASKANHRGHIERTYGLSEDDYAALLRWQGGRCYVCGQQPHSRRLAVDHDHVTGAVRGLLCANDEFGCNVQLRRILGDRAAAGRLLQYVQQGPLERMRDGQPRPFPSGRQLDPFQRAAARQNAPAETTGAFTLEGL